MSDKVRAFQGKAYRDTDIGKLDYEGFLSPVVLERFAQYMDKHRNMAVGRRDSDNWQDGMPRDQYIKSLWRHFMHLWKRHRGYNHEESESIEEDLCAVLFNVMGYLHETIKERRSENRGTDGRGSGAVPSDTGTESGSLSGVQTDLSFHASSTDS